MQAERLYCDGPEVRLTHIRYKRDGIERGDIFVEVEGKSVEDIASLKEMIAAGARAVQARIFRKARFLSITLHTK